MQRLEKVIQIIKYVKNNPMREFTYEEIILGMNNLEVEYTEVRGENTIKLIPHFDTNIELVISEESQFKISKYDLIHILINDLQAYYDELVIENIINESDVSIAVKKIELYEARGIRTWEDKKVLVDVVLSKYHDDSLIATLMLLKHSNAANKQISYIERHFTEVKYAEFQTDVFIELYNKKYERFASIDLKHCQIIEDTYELIIGIYQNVIKPTLV